jgi:hypothetical protein
LLAIGSNVGGEFGRDRKAFFRVVDGGLQRGGQTEAAEFAQCIGPCAHSTRNGHGQHTGIRNGLQAPLAKDLGLGQLPGTATAVQGIHAATLRFAIQQKGITAHAIHVWAHHRQHRGHGNRCIHRVAAAPQHIHAGRCRQRMIRDDRRIGARDFRAHLSEQLRADRHHCNGQTKRAAFAHVIT